MSYDGTLGPSRIATRDVLYNRVHMKVSAAINLATEGKTHEAQLECESRLASAPDDVEALSLLADIYLSAGRAANATDLLRRLAHLHPEDGVSMRRLGSALLLAAQPGEAVDALNAAIALDPTNTRGHNNLGQALMQLGRWPEAIASYREALRLDPGYAIAHHNLGAALVSSGAADEAIKAYQDALTLAPRMAEAWEVCGNLFARQQRFSEALECFESVLRLRPADAQILSQKASVLLSLEQLGDALECADLALRADERSAPAHNVKAGALRRLGRRSEALRSLDRALALSPDYPEAWCNRGMILHEIGDHQGAVGSYRRGVQLRPGDLQARTRLVARHIPAVPASQADAAAARRVFDTELREFEAWLGAKTLDVEEALSAAQQQFFYLAYDEVSNRSLLERYRGACAARIAALKEVGELPRSATAAAPRHQRRFKLGFVSAHVREHSVYHAILRGWLKCLDPERFELHLFSLDPRADELTREAQGFVEHFVSGTKPTREWIRAIREQDLDAVVYPEIGMNETTLALAATRLAPRQFAAWGHPETSGLPTIDCYLSAELLEPPEAQEHYTETLVRLPNLGIYCKPHDPKSMDVDLASFQIPDGDPLLICPGVPYKYQPQDDIVLVEIARRLGRGSFLLFQHESGELSRKLHERIAGAFRNAGIDPGRHLRTIPWQPRAAFYGLLRRADVYLDTIGFSGFNTMLQALECRLPCVTYRGAFMRGRLGSGILTRVGLPELVANDRESYVDLAVAIVEHAVNRARIRRALELNTAIAFADTSAVDAFAQLLLDG
jgi:protein O-GlcNAc transferase